jgi:hypothetical protein
MIYSEFKRHLGKAGVSVHEFAALIDVQPSSVSNYAKKNLVPSTYAVIAVVLGDAADNGSDFRTTLRKFGIPKASRKQARRVARMEDYRGRKPAR